MTKVFIILGASRMTMSAGMGALGAYGLEGKLFDKCMLVWEKAMNYQMYHGLGLVLIGIISGITSINVDRTGWFLFFGIMLLSGSSHILALTQIRILEAITPIGDIPFIVGWLMLVIVTFKFVG